MFKGIRFIQSFSDKAEISVVKFLSWDLYSDFAYFPIIKSSLIFAVSGLQAKVLRRRFMLLQVCKTSCEIHRLKTQKGTRIFSQKDSVGPGWEWK